MPEHQVRIFVSSPADLDHERALVRDIVDQLAQEYLPYFKLQAVLWEEEALTAAQSFQAGLRPPSACEIVLVMLWTRLGTPLAEDPYGGMTGTEWEFLDAVEASARSGRPEVLVYRKTTPRLVDITNAAATSEAVQDLQRMEDFFKTHFFNADGSFRRAFRQFDSDRVLRELIAGQLRKLLNRRISAERGALAQAGDWRTSPFRASVPYDLADEPVFVGRETETRELVARLDEARGSGRGLVLVTGASGVGKTSLIRAGLLPRLARPFLFPGLASCRWCLVDYTAPQASDLPSSPPLDRLARALAAADALGPALDAFGLDPAGLARLLASDPGLAVQQLRAALAQTGSDSGLTGPDGTQFALILDPLDGILSTAALADPATRTFATALAALATAHGIWVIATLRSDCLHRLPSLPPLAELVDQESWFPLESQPPVRIRQVMEIPARVAGIEYEGAAGAAGLGLVERLEAEAANLIHWPATLEHALEALYGHSGAPDTAPTDNVDDPPDPSTRPTGTGRRLTLGAYRALGGIAGSVERRADTLWAQQPPASRAALPMLCRALISLDGGPRARPSPRSGDLNTLRRDPGCAALIESLLEARLATADAAPDPVLRQSCARQDERLMDALGRIARETREEWRTRWFNRRGNDAPAGGHTDSRPVATAIDGLPGPDVESAPAPDWRDYLPIVGLTHPVLLERWGPVRDWLAEPANRRDLELRTQIDRQARLWKRTDCNREHLLGESGYAAARRFARAHEVELEPLERDYLGHSHANLLFQRRRNRAVRLVGITLAVLLALASGAALWAWQASRQATLSLHHSQLNAAERAINQGNTPEAVRLALDAGAYLPQAATDTLSHALTSNRLIAMAQGDDVKPLPPAFSDDGERLVTLSEREGAQLWGLARNRFLPQGALASRQLGIHGVLVAGSGDQAPILGLGPNGVWRLPATADSPPDWSCMGHPEGAVALDDGRRYLALSRPGSAGRHWVCVLDLSRPGRPLWDRPLHQGEIRSLAFAPDGMSLVSAAREGRALLIDTITGFERLSLPPGRPLSRPINRAVFDYQGSRVALACADERVRVFGLDGRLRANLGTIERDGRTLRVHKTAVRDAVFSSDGRFVLAGDDEGQLVRWDLDSGNPEILGQHRLSIEQVRVTGGANPREEEPLVLTASLDKTARLWGQITGKEVAVFSHDAAVSNARFTTDHQRVLTHSDMDGSARLWGVEPTAGIAFRMPQGDHVWHLDMAPAPAALDPDPKVMLIASAAFDGLVQVWRYDRKASWIAPMEIWRLAGHRGRVRRVSFSPSGLKLASAAYDGSVRLWDMLTGGGCTLEPALEPDGAAADRSLEIYHALFAPDELWLLTAGGDPQRPVRLWDPATCGELPLPPAFEHGPAKVQAVALTNLGQGTAPGGQTGVQLAATGNDAGTLRVMRRNPDGDWALLCRLQVSADALTEVAFAPDGRTLAAVGEGGQVTLTTLSDSNCVNPRTLDGGTGALYSLAFSPDGQALATAAIDGRAQVWDLNGVLIANLVGHKDRVYSVEFSPDGRWLVTASRDGTVRLWERPSAPAKSTTLLSPSGELEAPNHSSYLVLNGELGGVAMARFSPDGHSIGAAYWENAAVLWRLWTEDTNPNPALESVWGRDRARLSLIREAARFREDNRLDAGPGGGADR